MSAQTTLFAPFAGTVVAVPHAVNQTVCAGTTVAVIEAMKMWIETLFDDGAPHWSKQSGKRRPYVDSY